MEFHPYSKADQLKSHQREKPTPQYKERKAKKKKNPYIYRGRTIPKRKERTAITPKEYKMMIEVFGEYCTLCGHTPISAHHLVFRSQLGSGKWRNLCPLCLRCHGRVHKDTGLAQRLRDERAERFGEHFGKDVWSLFKEGLVNNTTDECYERFFIEQEKLQMGQ